MMTLAQATALHFDGRYDAASKRMQILKAAGYIGDRRKRIGAPSVLFLTKKAFDHLTAEGRIRDYPKLTPEQFHRRSRIKEATEKHELSVMEVRVALTCALSKTTEYHVEEFTTWPLLSEFIALHPTRNSREPVRPDGFLGVLELRGVEREFAFFLELDRSHEVQRVLVEKALCYRDFYSSGGYAKRCGGDAKDFRDYPFRVLMVLQSHERRNNSAERLMNCTPPVKSQVWLTTLSELLAEPLGKIWVCPLDYAHATTGTAYAPEHCRDDRSYVRRSEREKLVEERIVKRMLFDDVRLSSAT
jgi:hypothetical protein